MLGKYTKTFGASLREHANHFNRVTHWIASTIVLEEDLGKRRKIVKKWIKIGQHFKELNNFNSMSMIVGGLEGQAAVFRLKNMFEGISTWSKNLLRELQGIVTHERNFAKIREMQSRGVHPLIPYTGVFLSDIAFVHDSNYGSEDTPRGVIDWKMMTQLHQSISEMWKWKTISYDFPVNLPLVRKLLASIEASQAYSSEDLYKKSLKLEPSTRRME
jgi:son of sevenless-like protein